MPYYASTAGCGAAVAEVMGGLNGSGLPKHLDRPLQASNVGLPPSGPISQMELHAALIAGAMLPADRIAVKHTLAALRLTA